jgi:phospholipid/cholesterol/gamma-HCH transport system substrate-binding protein
MASTKKVAWSQLKVGVVGLAALAILAVLVFLLTGAENPFSKKATLYTYMRDSAALTDGAGVRLNGILIGKVTRVELTNDPNLNRTIRMTMQIERKFLTNIPDDSQLGFSAESVLGQKFINIRRGKSPRSIHDQSEIKAQDDKDFLEIVQSAMPLLDSMQSILGRVDKIVSVIEAGKGSIGRLIADDEIYDRVNSLLADVQKMTQAVTSGQGTIGRLLYDETLYTDLRHTIVRLDNLMAGLESGQGTAGKLLKDPALYDDLHKSTTELKTLLSDLNAGKGSAGKLLKNDELHAKLSGTLDRLNNTMDRVNAGQGTLGQLMVNPTLYNNLAGTTDEFHSFMKDFRKNPKKFLTIQLKLF